MTESKGHIFCALPITVSPDKVLIDTRLQMERHLGLAAECAKRGFAVPVTDDQAFGHTYGYMITRELAEELVAEGRLKWIT